MELTNTSSLGHQSPEIKEGLLCGCTYLLALARQLEKVEGRTCSQDSESQWENILTVCAHGLQEYSRGVPYLRMYVDFQPEWENAMTTHTYQPQAGNETLQQGNGILSQ